MGDTFFTLAAALAAIVLLLAVLAGPAFAAVFFLRSRRLRAEAGTLEEKLHRAERKLEDITREDQDQKFAIAEKSLALLELKEKLEEEQAKTQRLLRNILPEKIIEELRDNGFAKPELFENVTVFFSDIVNFTEISAKIDPVDLIGELSDIFGHFDEIFVRNGCERIKTIGDAYMSVSGLPVPDPKHCENIVNAAREALRYLAERNRTGKYRWQMRMGIHSGSVVAGIVGTNKYIYDVFGDTVNTSARMEQNSEKMRINLSADAKKLVEDRFKFEEREAVDVHGKGLMKMYFLAEDDPEESK